MELFFHAVAACRDGFGQVAGAPAGLAFSLFLAGLGGSAVHCVGMCGPFVLGQVMADAGRRGAGGYGEWRRLAGAALVPYHLGRLTTYTGLGTMAGGATALFASTAAFAWLSGCLLIAGAALMLAQAFGLALGAAAPQAGLVQHLAAPLTSSRHPAARYGLGVVLGFLPCGLIYGALGAAAGTGSMLHGTLGMAAFSLGTTPALVAVGWGGVLLRRRWQGTARWMAAPLLILTALLMLALASQRF
ncbi:MAG: sulfite exporter TauE/SafE family protein [Enhydrobacter sp.]|nr:sulfite exporter TauE/SafE family protein [Enhydrobacter sp.]